MHATSETHQPTDVCVTDPDRIDGVVPGVQGHRAFPVRHGLRDADPFLMLDHIGPQRIDPTRVIDGKPHPHRGFETVSIMLAGELDHVDSLGNRTAVRAGDLQVMNAGSGIIHGGDMRPDPSTGNFHEFQLWVNVPAARKMDPPSVQDVKASSVPSLEEAGASIRVLAGEYRGVTAPVATTAPTTILHAKIESAATWRVGGFDPTDRLFVYVVGGSVTTEGRVATEYQTLDLGGANHEAELASGGAGAEILVLAGRPLGEPVAFGGPFVMNTQAQIDQAFADYQAGRFGSVRRE